MQNRLIFIFLSNNSNIFFACSKNIQRNDIIVGTFKKLINNTYLLFKNEELLPKYTIIVEAVM